MSAAPPRHVLMTADAVGGVWQYALDLIGGLSSKGVRTTLVLLGPSPTDEQRRSAAAIPGLALLETGLPLDWLAEGESEVVEAGFTVGDIARQVGADLVQLNSPALAAGDGMSVPVVAMQHSCVATWWASTKGGPLPPDFRWQAAMVGRGLRAAAAVVAPSHSFASDTALVHGLAQVPQVVHNGRTWPADGGHDDETGDFVFTAGRLWDEAKNIRLIDRAATRLDVPVVVAGPLHGPNGAAVACEHLRTLGSLSAEATREWLLHRPIYVSPALYEPFGLAVLEAAQAGCALVLSDIGTFREIWGGAALFVPPNDEAALAEANAALVRDPQRRRALEKAAQVRAKRYSTAAMVEGMLQVYRALGSRPTVQAEGAA